MQIIFAKKSNYFLNINLFINYFHREEKAEDLKDFGNLYSFAKFSQKLMKHDLNRREKELKMWDFISKIFHFLENSNKIIK